MKLSPIVSLWLARVKDSHWRGYPLLKESLTAESRPDPDTRGARPRSPQRLSATNFQSFLPSGSSEFELQFPPQYKGVQFEGLFTGTVCEDGRKI